MQEHPYQFSFEPTLGCTFTLPGSSPHLKICIGTPSRRENKQSATNPGSFSIGGTCCDLLPNFDEMALLFAKYAKYNLKYTIDCSVNRSDHSLAFPIEHWRLQCGCRSKPGYLGWPTNDTCGLCLRRLPRPFGIIGYLGVGHVPKQTIQRRIIGWGAPGFDLSRCQTSRVVRVVPSDMLFLEECFAYVAPTIHLSSSQAKAASRPSISTEGVLALVGGHFSHEIQRSKVYIQLIKCTKCLPTSGKWRDQREYNFQHVL